MPEKENIVFVLWAWFTKAFDNDAPLLMSDVWIERMKNKFKNWLFENIVNFLNTIEVNDKNEVNVENLFSRLYSWMPFDWNVFNSWEKDMLLHEFKKEYFSKIKLIKSYEELDEDKKNIINKFAKFCVDSKDKYCVDIISFNYDTLLDEALFKVNPKHDLYKWFHWQPPYEWEKYWHPDGWYWFFCKPALSCIRPMNNFKDKTPSELLKLHWSLNWRIKKWFNIANNFDTFVHKEEWLYKIKIDESDESDIENHLWDIFIIPPILDKSIINNNPVLTTIWSSAFQKLKNTNKVIFVWYSLPATDIAASFLFSESLKNKWKEITVLLRNWDNYKENEKRYYDVLWKDIQIKDINCASEWINNCEWMNIENDEAEWVNDKSNTTQ